MKKLYRSRNNRMIAGVCGGLAEYYKFDPTIVRLGFVLLTILPSFPGLFVYCLAWIIIPDEKHIRR